MTNTKTKHDISVRGETYEKLRKRARELGVPINQLVQQWVEEKLDAVEVQIPPANLLL